MQVFLLTGGLRPPFLGGVKKPKGGLLPPGHDKRPFRGLAKGRTAPVVIVSVLGCFSKEASKASDGLTRSRRRCPTPEPVVTVVGDEAISGVPGGLLRLPEETVTERPARLGGLGCLS